MGKILKIQISIIKMQEILLTIPKGIFHIEIITLLTQIERVGQLLEIQPIKGEHMIEPLKEIETMVILEPE